MGNFALLYAEFQFQAEAEEALQQKTIRDLYRLSLKWGPNQGIEVARTAVSEGPATILGQPPPAGRAHNNQLEQLPMISLRILLLALVSLSFPTFSGASDHYVATNGRADGDGTAKHPWDLQTALNQPESVRPGDTIWVLGGTYHSSAPSGFVNKLNGTSIKPIVVRSFGGERTTIDAHGADFGLAIYGSYTWFWGLEVFDSTTLRISTGTARTNAFGVGIYGMGIKCINMVVHDTAEGFSGYNASPDSEYYGNLIYYNGYVGTDRNHGHGMYFQNNTGGKVVSDNFVGDNAGEGIQIYGSASAALINFIVNGNTLYNNSSWPVPHYQYNLIVAGGQIRKNITVQDNFSYYPAGAKAGGFAGQFGQYSQGQDISVTGNVFADGYLPVAFNGQTGPVVFTGNTVIAGTDALRPITLDLLTSQTTSTYTWDNNKYYDESPFHFFLGLSADGSNFVGVNEAFTDWRARTGFDAHSAYNPNAPTGVWTFLRPNKYEAKRANLTIFNWDIRPTVSVDLSHLLERGDKYVIRDVQDFYGTPVASGTYTGSLVNVPMAGLMKAPGVGFASPEHTAPKFGTFVVLGLSQQ